MLRVGLTGGIGSGKSTAARRLAELGAIVVDADVIAREVVEPGAPGFDAVVAEFGSDVVAADGSLDRPALGKIVFADPQRREALNAIVHPLVYQRRTELVDSAPADAVVVEDIPLLVENGLAATYHLVIVVGAAEDERVRRLVEHRGMTADEAWARVTAQADDDARRAVADVWLDNSGPIDNLLRQVDAVWRQRLVPFEENLRTGTVADGPRPADLVAYDDTWPRQAERLISRIMAAAGDRVSRVDHVGGTAVPGLDARDTIDILVVARSADDLPDLHAALVDGGFPEQPRSQAAYASADPGRPAEVHVYEQSDDTWRIALLMRDWLRANADERSRYNQWERAFVTSGEPTAEAYAELKRDWWDGAVVRAREWAAQSNWSP